MPQIRVEHYKYKNILELAAYICRFRTPEMEKAFAELLLRDLYPPAIASFSGKNSEAPKLLYCVDCGSTHIGEKI